MKLPWRRIVFLALLMFIVPFMIVYSTTKNDRKVKPISQPKPPNETVAEEKPADTSRAAGPLTYVTAHNKETYTLLYYPDRESARLIPVAKRLSGYEPGLEEALSALFDKNYAPPGLNKSALSPDTRLLSVGANGNTAVVDFSDRLLSDQADSSAALLAINTIAKVAQQFPYEKLDIKMNGKRLNASLQAGLAENPLNLRQRPTDSYVFYRPLVTGGLVYLYPETVEEPPAPAKVVNGFLNSLSGDTADMYKKIYISPDVRLLSAAVQNGQATLNFNRALQDHFNEFAKQFSNRQMAENFFFDAVILSLTEIPEIQEVRFLIDGEQINSLNNPSVGNYLFTRPKNINPVN
ncbi:MAG: GerMN domain-containing protein [Bacillota bacterium]